MNSESSWQLALPFRGTPGGKSRLLLEHRGELALTWLRHVLEQCQGVAQFSRITVVGRSAGPPLLGVDYLQQRRPGLNGAIQDWLERYSPQRWVVLLPDLPLLKSSEVAALMEACPPGGWVVACDRHQQGSNALACDGGPPFLTRFGAGSLEAHRNLADELGRPFQLLNVPGLACDVDTLNDWEALQCRSL